MPRLVVLFNLKPGTDVAAYERWAKATDLPTVRKLSSVGHFSVWKSAGLLGSAAKPPYQYVEIIDITDMGGFGGEVASPTMQKVAGEFQAFADNPVFILTDELA